MQVEIDKMLTDLRTDHLFEINFWKNPLVLICQRGKEGKKK
jgi:hypothetical protein